MTNRNIKILRIDSSARGDGSETRALSDALIGRIEATANTTVTHRDLAVDAPDRRAVGHLYKRCDPFLSATKQS